jgi:hypothetical protein
VMIQVAQNLVGRPAGKENKFPRRSHLNSPRVAFEPLYMSVSGGALGGPPASRRPF